ncbi:MAG TPA: metallophosphoesterase [Longimicrobium sp.]|nr:metallophosphoesterase [Longimicrobium sp.]
MRPYPFRMAGTRPGLTLALAAAVLFCAPPESGAQARGRPVEGGTVLLVSDLHFDPFTAGGDVVKTLRATPTAQWARVLAAAPAAPPSTYGSDSNYPLLVSAGAAMRQAVPRPAFVVVTGDFLGHDFEQKYDSLFAETPDSAGAAAFADSTMAFMARWMGALFPADVPIYPGIGNNDSGCNDYGMDTQFQRAAARSWARLAQRGGRAPGFVAAFDSGGYYTARPPAANATLVMLNDIYWSRSYDPACGPDRGARELAWLEGVLRDARAANRRVWLASHIPPGVDIYSSLKDPANPTMMFTAAYVAPFDSLVRAYADVVALHLTGHTHMNEFRVYETPGGGGVPGVGVPAVSPLFGNNPGFVSMRLDPSGSVLDYTAYAFTGGGAAPQPGAGGWITLFDFGALYGQSAVTGAAMRAAAARIASDATVRSAWQRNYTGGRTGQNPTDANWHGYWCAIGNLEASTYAACAQSSPPSP